MEQAVLMCPTAKHVTTDRRSELIATPHRSPCFAAGATATIIPEANSTRYSRLQGAKPPVAEHIVSRVGPTHEWHKLKAQTIIGI